MMGCVCGQQFSWIEKKSLECKYCGKIIEKPLDFLKRFRKFGTDSEWVKFEQKYLGIEYVSEMPSLWK